jgi:F-type H+-transporting ATPase subunit d
MFYTNSIQVAAAKETVTKITAEETSLNETLSNIQDARPFEDLTVSNPYPAWPSTP